MPKYDPKYEPPTDDPYMCDECGELVRAKRRALGYTLCLACGELHARKQRANFLVDHSTGLLLVPKLPDDL